MRKRMFVSGYPWWFVTAFFILCAFFGLLGVVVSLPGLGFTLLGIIVFALVYRLSSPQVYLCDDHLSISRMGRTVRVPLECVARLEEAKASWPFGRYSAVLHFTTDTPFGRSLYLGSFGIVPSMTFPWGVRELRQALSEVAAKRSNQAMQRTAGRSAL